MSRVLILIVACVVLLGACVGIYLWNRGDNDSLLLYGVVEVQEVRLGSKVGGRVVEVRVREGDVVKSGAKLVLLDGSELQAKRDQYYAKLLQAEADLFKTTNGARVEEIQAAKAAAQAAKFNFEKMKKGSREEEIRQAASELESADADFKQSDEELRRTKELYMQKSASQKELDAALAFHNRAKGRMLAAKAHRDLVLAGNRAEDIAMAKADWDKAKAQSDLLEDGSRWEDISLAQSRVLEAQGKLDEIDTDLREMVVTAPEDAIVDVVAVRKGDIVGPNQTVVRVLRRDDLWVRVYIPETELGKVRTPQKVKVFIDSYPKKSFEGVAYHVNSVSEFTPRNIQSVDERHHQVFGIRVRVQNTEDIFKAGMAARVVFPLHDASSPDASESLKGAPPNVSPPDVARPEVARPEVAPTIAPDPSTTPPAQD